MANETQDQSAANGITVIQLVSRFGRGLFGLGYAALISLIIFRFLNFLPLVSWGVE